MANILRLCHKQILFIYVYVRADCDADYDAEDLTNIPNFPNMPHINVCSSHFHKQIICRKGHIEGIEYALTLVQVILAYSTH